MAVAALAAPQSIQDAYYALVSLATLKAAGHTVAVPDLKPVAELFTEAVHSTGAVRPTPSTKLPSFAATGQAWLAIAAARTLQKSFSVPSVESGAAKVQAPCLNGGCPNC